MEPLLLSLLLSGVPSDCLCLPIEGYVLVVQREIIVATIDFNRGSFLLEQHSESVVYIDSNGTIRYLRRQHRRL